ncbi:MAG: hypothetical protein ACI9U2_004710, partial [Bradymonadia bacterium]
MPFLSVLLLAGCGGAPLTPPPSSARLALAYPTALYIMATGESDSRLAAEAAAKAGVSEQISARIESSLSVRTRSDGTHEDQKIDARINSSSSFSRAELIRVVPKHGRCVEGRCSAVAVLHRGEADAALAKDYVAPAERFRRASEAAVAAERITEFTRQFRVAEDAWRAVRPLAAWRDAITGAAEVAQDAERHARLLAARDDRLKTLRLAVIAPADDMGQTTAGALAAAFTRMGISARPATTCSAGYAVSTSGAVECGTGSFGPRCALPLQVGLKACPDGAPLA